MRKGGAVGILARVSARPTGDSKQCLLSRLVYGHGQRPLRLAFDVLRHTHACLGVESSRVPKGESVWEAGWPSRPPRSATAPRPAPSPFRAALLLPRPPVYRWYHGGSSPQGSAGAGFRCATQKGCSRCKRIFYRAASWLDVESCPALLLCSPLPPPKHPWSASSYFSFLLL